MRLIAPVGLLALASPLAAQSIHDRIYQPPREPLSLAGLPPEARLFTVTTTDGLSLTGVEVPGRSDRPMLIVFHGNGSDADGTVQWLRPLLDRGYGMVAAEYRGYSANPGRPDERGLAADAEAFFARAEALAGSRPVVIIGHSLGGGVAFGLAKRHEVAALITIGAFSRLRAMAPKIARALISDRYDNEASLSAIEAPFFQIHGTADDVVPAAEGNRLYHAAIAAKRQGGAFVLDGVGHRPDGALIAQLVDASLAKIADPAAAQALPAGVRFFPFR